MWIRNLGMLYHWHMLLPGNVFLCWSTEARS
jgi:hypothetical protein